VKKLGDPSTGKYVTKYVVDLNVKTLITEIRIYADKNNHFTIPAEYRSDVIYGPNVKALSVTLYSEGIMSNDRIAAFLNAASEDELSLSAGSVYGFCKKFAAKSEMSIEHLDHELLNQTVVATDATTITNNGKQNYIRNFSITDTVLYRAMKCKTIEAMHKISFLEKFTGILVHDHETALYHFGIDHAECNVHIIRYLRKNSEDTKNPWADKLIALLCKMNKERKEAISQGKQFFIDDEISAYEKSYIECISQGRKENKKQNTNMQNRTKRHY
jgi:transposase